MAIYKFCHMSKGLALDDLEIQTSITSLIRRAKLRICVHRVKGNCSPSQRVILSEIAVL